MLNYIPRLLAAVLLCSSSFAYGAQRCELCPRDYNGRILRSAAAKAEFKRQQPCPSTKKSRGNCPGYVIDHIVALKRGGPDIPANMQWQTLIEGKAKDKWE